MKKLSLFSLAGILIVFLAVSVTTSCKSKKEKEADRVERMIEQATGEEVDIDTEEGEIVIETEDGTITATDQQTTWPEDIPDDVPEFDFGDIVVVSSNTMEGGYGWTLVMENVPDNAINEYEKALKENGWEVQKVTMGKGGNLNGQKGKQYVAVMAGEGGASISVQIEE